MRGLFYVNFCGEEDGIFYVGLVLGYMFIFRVIRRVRGFIFGIGGRINCILSIRLRVEEYGRFLNKN